MGIYISEKKTSLFLDYSDSMTEYLEVYRRIVQIRAFGVYQKEQKDLQSLMFKSSRSLARYFDAYEYHIKAFEIYQKEQFEIESQNTRTKWNEREIIINILRHKKKFQTNPFKKTQDLSIRRYFKTR